jgi:hypothetical protein
MLDGQCRHSVSARPRVRFGIEWLPGSKQGPAAKPYLLVQYLNNFLGQAHFHSVRKPGAQQMLLNMNHTDMTMSAAELKAEMMAVISWSASLQLNMR